MQVNRAAVEGSKKLGSEFVVRRVLAGAQRDRQSLAKRAFTGASGEFARAVNQNPPGAQFQLTRRDQQCAFDFEALEIRVAIKHDRSTGFNAYRRTMRWNATVPRCLVRPALCILGELVR